MYLKIPHRKIMIRECNTLKTRFCSLKFQLNPIDYGLFFPNKKFISTSFFCQRVDLCFTDKNQKILYLHSRVKSEKRFLHWKAKNIFVLPPGISDVLKVGDVLYLIEK